MKHLKTLGLVAVAAAAMMAFAASASADQVSTTTGGAAATPGEGGTAPIHFVNEGGHVSIANSLATISCSSTITATVTSHAAGSPVGAHLGNLNFTGCTNGWTVFVLAPGTISLTHTSGHNGTVSSTGMTLTAVRHTIFGTVHCHYSTNNAHIGTISGGNPATLIIEGKLFLHPGPCGSGDSQWTGSYVTTGALYVANS